VSYDREKDPFADRARSMAAPASGARLLTPSDTQELDLYSKALRVYVPLSLGEATIRVTPLLAADEAAVTLTFLTGVFTEPLVIRKLWATGTTPGVVVHGYEV